MRDSTGVRIGDLLDTFDKMSVHAPSVSKRNAAPSESPRGQPMAFFSVRGPQVETFIEEVYYAFMSARYPNDSEDSDHSNDMEELE